jgi:hypothetical protein
MEVVTRGRVVAQGEGWRVRPVRPVRGCCGLWWRCTEVGGAGNGTAMGQPQLAVSRGGIIELKESTEK